MEKQTQAAPAPGLMFKRIAPLLLAVAVLFLLLAAFLPSVSFLFQFCALACLGALLLLLCYYPWPKPRLAALSRLARRLIWAALLLFAVSFIWLQTLIAGAAQGSPAPQSHYLLVLGAAVHGSVPSATLAARLDTAAGYLRQHPESVAVLSGGQGPGEDISEAQAMYEWLTARGISPERLHLEDRSTSTTENFAFSLPILSALNQDETPLLLVVSTGYHLYRAGLIAERQGLPEIETLAAPMPPIPLLKASSYLREYFSIIKFRLLSP